jgi:Tol biopolymer transport system component
MVPGHLNPRGRAWVAVAVLLAACQAAPATTPTTVANVPSAAPSPESTVAASLAPVPPGRIVFMRGGSDEVEHYFTINSDGTDEREIYTAQECGCAHWMADGSRVMSLGESGKDVWSLMTVRPDGTDRVVIPTPIKTLSLAVGATTLDGKWLAFNGWDNEVPSNAGLYLARPDLTKLRLVVPLQEGINATEPFGVTPDGSKVVFFAETGKAAGMTHGGDVYVVNADGSHLRRLNPTGTKTGWIGPPVVSLSPDGRRAAFAVAEDGVYVADLDSGEATLLTDQDGFEWGVAWSPTGEWIAYSLNRGGVNVVELVRPDGTEPHQISAKDDPGGVEWSAWSPDGTALLVQRHPRGKDTDLWIMDLQGNYLGQLTHEPSGYGFYGWAPK